jgi:hypothetical protein
MKDSSFAFDNVDERRRITSESFRLIRRVHEDIHGPGAQAEQATDFDRALRWALVRFHFDEQVEVAVWLRITPRVTAEEDYLDRIEALHDAADHVVDQALIDRRRLRPAAAGLH